MLYHNTHHLVKDDKTAQNNATSWTEERDFLVNKINAETFFANALVFFSCSGDTLIFKNKIIICQMKT